MLFHPCGWVGAEVLTCSLTTGLGRDGAVRIKRGLDSNGGKKEKKRKGEIKRETVRGGCGGWHSYCFLRGQQTGADSRTAYLSAGIPQPDQRKRQEATSTMNS